MEPLPADTWRRLLRRAPADSGVCPLYGPLIAPPTARDGCYVLGRIAQSLDGCIATASGATREVEGPSPVRVVLDTERRLHDHYRMFRDGPETLLLCARDAAAGDRIGEASVLRLPRAGKGLDVAAVVGTLAERGLRRIFVEGGGITVSRFLAAGLLDRLHVTIAPMLIGSGIPAFTLPQAAALSDVLRFDWSVHRIGADVLVDIPLKRAHV
jgi:riboflavin biosynthesis pyrimidine reductase